MGPLRSGRADPDRAIVSGFLWGWSERKYDLSISIYDIIMITCLGLGDMLSRSPSRDPSKPSGGTSPTACVKACLLRSQFLLNTFPQLLHSYGLWSVWVRRWVLRLDRWLNDLEHTWHLWGDSSIWRILWTARVLDWQKPLPHSLHLKGFSLEWMYLKKKDVYEFQFIQFKRCYGKIDLSHSNTWSDRLVNNEEGHKLYYDTNRAFIKKCTFIVCVIVITNCTYSLNVV